MKDYFLSILRPIFLFFLKWNLLGLKPLFLSEDEKLKIVVREKGFHSALCTHPSIVFGERRVVKGHIGCLRSKVAFLKKCIKIGLLKDKKGCRLMQELGVQPCFVNGTEFWFEDSRLPIRPYYLPEVEKPKGQLVVYSVLTGDYDDVHEILYKEEGVDYYLFTNNPSLKSKTWKVILVDSELDNVLLSREIKMLPHKYLGDKYELSIYIDADAVIYGELSQLTRYMSEAVSLAVSKHTVRHSIKEEIDACTSIIGIEKGKAMQQYEGYLNEGYVDDKPLLECGILVRRHGNLALQQLEQNWFEEFKNGIRRDQLSLLPCMSRTHFEDYVVMDGSVWHNQFNRNQHHKK